MTDFPHQDNQAVPSPAASNAAEALTSASTPAEPVPAEQETALETTASDETAPAVQAPISGAEDAFKRRRNRWLDALLFLALFFAALPIRFANTKGDLWFDEAEYAIAGVSGAAANRWDRSDNPSQPEKMLRLHHYHPPLTAELIGIAHQFGSDDRTIRTPFVLSGALVVSLVYLCGLFLFPEQRILSLGCAILTLLTPGQIRQSSHAIPWILITLALMSILTTMLGYWRTRKPGWIVGLGVALGGFWVASEMSLLIAPLALGVLVVLLWPDWKIPEKRRGILYALLGSLACFVAIVLTFWPIGLGPHALQTLLHYTNLREFSIPVTLGGQQYPNAPKWAYYYWYRTRYFPYFALYAAGALAIVVQALRRKVDVGTGILVLLTLLIAAIAHKAHIIGPEYFAHVLPFLTLWGGYFFVLANSLHKWVGPVLMVLLCGRIAVWKDRNPMAGMEPRAQISRWPLAAQWLSARWKPGDRLAIGPQPPPVARWYLAHTPNIRPTENNVVQLAYQNTTDVSLKKVELGFYRFIAVSSTVLDHPSIDARLQNRIQPWRIWQSPEPENGSPRLTLYQWQPGTAKPAVSSPAPAKPRPAMPDADSPDDNTDSTE